MNRKRYAKILSAVNTDGNTIFYEATLQDIISAFDSLSGNIWIAESFRDLGFDAINFDSGLFGSRVIDNKLYICDTDGFDIDVDGESYNPEELFDYVHPEDVEELIRPATKQIIFKYITTYELNDIDYNKLAPRIIHSGVDFTDMVSDYNEIED